MNLGDVLGLLTLVVGVPLNLYVVRKARALSVSLPGLRVLRRDVQVLVIVLISAVVYGLIFTNNDMDQPLVTGEATRLITRAAQLLLVIGVPVGWLWLYRKA